VRTTESDDPNLSATEKGVRPIDPWIGRTLKKYAIVARLGQGGMGVVYLAEDNVLKRAVAIKMIANSLTNEAKGLRRFLREAQSAARLQHANVVAIYDIDQDQGTHYLVMEFVPGPSAQQISDRDGPLPWRVAVQIVAEACRGLSAAHASNLIHRDVKPANLLVSRTGEVKLGDFGLAKAISGDQVSITQGKYLNGTPQYMSPEQAKNEDLDERSDLYSLGATLYTLLTGAPPFAGKDLYATMYAHATLPVPDPRQKCPDIPEACVKIVERAMAKRRTDRYDAAPAMLADLEATLGPQRESLGPLAEKFDIPHPAEASSLFTLNVAQSRFRLPGRWPLVAALLAGLALVGFTFVVCAGALGWHWIGKPEHFPESPEQLRRDLKARNPAFKGAFKEIEQRNGRIVRVVMSLDGITDITPLGELSELEELELNGSGQPAASFSDISPLAKLKKLTYLWIGNCHVKNLEALRDMKKLTRLNLGVTRVEDVSDLRGLPITNLRLGATPVASLKRLEDAPIEILDLYGCPALNNLDGLPSRKLHRLSLDSSGVTSLRGLENAVELTYLDIHGAEVTRKHRKDVLPRSLADADMKILLDLSRGKLEKVIGEFTADEAAHLRQESKDKLTVVIEPRPGKKNP
jgi:serine/threonine protein kinase